MTIQTNCVSLRNFVTLRPDFIRDALTPRGWDAFEEYFEEIDYTLTDEIIDNVFQYYDELTPSEYMEKYGINPAYFDSEDDMVEAMRDEGILLTSYETRDGIMLIIDCSASTPKAWRA